MNETKKNWYAFSVTVTPEYVEAAEFAFNELDSLGSEVDLLTRTGSELCTVTAYFTDKPDADRVAAEMRFAAGVFGLSGDVDFVIRVQVVEDQDWLAEWKKYWKPVETGKFLVAAPWHDVDAKGRYVIRIEPNMAFGTGTHETTRLCLAAVSDFYQPNQSFLDVGTGTGILAIGAAAIADPAAAIVAVDTDDAAVSIARDNAKLNNVADRITFLTGSIDAVEGGFDFVCANLTADVILPILSTLLDRARQRLVLSGILAEQETLILDSLPAGLQKQITRDGEWIAVDIETPGDRLGSIEA